MSDSIENVRTSLDYYTNDEASMIGQGKAVERSNWRTIVESGRLLRR